MAKNLCRACFQGSSDLKPIFEICSCFNICIAEMLMECCQIQVKYTEKNCTICNECLKILHVCYNFKKSCEEAQKSLFDVDNTENKETETKFYNTNDIKYDIKNENVDIYLDNEYNNSLIKVESKLENILENENKYLKRTRKKFKNSLNNEPILFKKHRTKKEKEFNCIKCEKKFRLKRSLQHHVLVTHLNDKPQIQCPNCPRSFTLEPNLKRHIKTVHEHKKLFKCHNCNKKFTRKITMIEHTEKYCKINETCTEMDSSEPLYRGDKLPCSICDQKFYSQYSLDKHLLQHSDPNLENFPCIQCNFVFVNQRDLKNHKIKKHPEVTKDAKRLLCSSCGKTFTHDYLLQQHLGVHTKNYLHKCQFCGKSFPYYSAYWLHLRIHANKRRYKCNYCERAFIQKQHLTSHTRQHTGEKPYSCDLCGRNFSQKQNRDSHRRTHTGEKPYACTMCEEKFYDSGRLSKHRKKVHSSE